MDGDPSLKVGGGGYSVTQCKRSTTISWHMCNISMFSLLQESVQNCQATLIRNSVLLLEEMVVYYILKREFL